MPTTVLDVGFLYNLQVCHSDTTFLTRLLMLLVLTFLCLRKCSKSIAEACPNSLYNFITFFLILP